MLNLTPGTKNNRLEKIAQQRLMSQIPFTEQDLGMNDDGYFSDAQKARLKPKTDLYIALCSIGAFMAFVIASVCFFTAQESDQYFWLTGIFVALFGICFFGINWSLALARQIRRGYGVKKVEGAADLYITYSGRNNDIPVYNLRIGDVYFRLTKEIYDAFESGEYRVYYFRLLRNEMLSVEPLN